MPAHEREGEDQLEVPCLGGEMVEKEKGLLGDGPEEGGRCLGMFTKGKWNNISFILSLREKMRQKNVGAWRHSSFFFCNTIFKLVNNTQRIEQDNQP